MNAHTESGGWDTRRAATDKLEQYQDTPPCAGVAQALVEVRDL